MKNIYIDKSGTDGGSIYINDSENIVINEYCAINTGKIIINKNNNINIKTYIASIPKSQLHIINTNNNNLVFGST